MADQAALQSKPRTICLAVRRAMASVLIGSVIPLAGAHTISIGYENSGDYELTFWYGSYHGGGFNEGSIRLQGPGLDQTVPYDLLTDSKPLGLADGATNFYSGGSSNQLESYNTFGTPVDWWQGREFTSLTAGTYTFTYVPIPTPTMNWEPINAAILSSSVTVITADLDVTTDRMDPGQVYDQHMIPADKLIFDGGTFRPTETVSLNHTVSVADAGGTIDSNGHDVTLNGDIDGRGRLVKSSAGTLTLNGNNTSIGGLALEGGVVNVSADASLGAPTAGLDFDGGTLQWGASFDLASQRAIDLQNGGGGFDTQEHTTTISQGITGSGSLNKLGSGTLVLSGNNSYSGETVIDGGTLALAGNGRIDQSAGLINNGSFDISGTNAGASVQSLAGSGDIQLGGQTLSIIHGGDTFSGDIHGAGGVALGGGVQTLTGNNTFSGGLAINGGTLEVAGAGSLGAGSVNIGNALLLALTDMDAGNAFALNSAHSRIDVQAQEVTLSGPISGSGTLNKEGDGALILSGVNTFTGGISLQTGELQVNQAASLGTGAVTVGNARLLAGDSFTAGNAVVLTHADATVDTQQHDLTLSGTLSGAGALNKTGSGTLTLSGSNSFSGGATVHDGALQVAEADNLGSGDLTLDGGRLQAGGDFSTATGVAIGAGGGTIDTQGNHLTLTGNVSGDGALQKQGAGILTLTGQNSQNGINLQGGILEFATDEALGASGGVVTINEDTTLRPLAEMTITRTLFVNNTESANFDTDAHDVTVAGNIGGAGVVQKLGTGKLTLSGTNTHVRMEVKNGEIAIASQGAAGAAGGDIYISQDGRFTTQTDMTISQNVHVTGTNARFDTGTHDVVLTGSAQGSNCLIKSGLGRLDMRSDSSNAIGACIEEGTLSFNSSFDGNVFVYEHGTAGGAGRVVGDMQVSGTLAPGNSPGVLTVAGSVTQAPGSTFLADIDGPVAGNGAGYHDQLVLTGATSVYTAGGTLQPILRGISGSASNSYSPDIGASFRLVTAEGGVQGSYSELTQPVAGLPSDARFDVVYLPDAIVLAVTPLSYAAVVGRDGLGNALAAAHTVDAHRLQPGVRNDSANGALQGELLGLNRAQLAGAFQSLAGEVHANSLDAMVQANAVVRTSVAGRLDQTLRSTPDSTDGQGPVAIGNGAWVMVKHSRGYVDGDHRAQGYNASTDALTIGGDRRVADAWLMGGAFGYTQTDLVAGESSGDLTGYQGLLYGRYDAGDVYASGIIGLGYQEYEIERTVTLPRAGVELTADTEGRSVTVDLETGKRLRWGAVNVTPAMGLAYEGLQRNAVTERGASAVALTVGDEHRDSLRGRVGVKFDGRHQVEQAVVRPYASLFAVNEFAAEAAAVAPSLGGARFTVSAPEAGRAALALQAGFSVQTAGNVQGYIDYEADARESGFAYTVRAGINYTW